jgi:hypothetical protein
VLLCLPRYELVLHRMDRSEECLECCTMVEPPLGVNTVANV